MLMLQMAATNQPSSVEKGTQTLDSSETVIFALGAVLCFLTLSSDFPSQPHHRCRYTLFSLPPSPQYTQTPLICWPALEAELLLCDAARAAAEGDAGKMKKELAAASALSADIASVRELQLAKETMQMQLDGERLRLQQLEHDYNQLQQREMLLLVKNTSLVAADKQRESEHAAAIADLRQQQQQQQNHVGRMEGSGGNQFNRMASVERSLSEGELAQQVTTDFSFANRIFAHCVMRWLSYHSQAATVLWNPHAWLSEQQREGHSNNGVAGQGNLLSLCASDVESHAIRHLGFLPLR